MKSRIKKGDNIVVITGKDAGKKAKVLKMLNKSGKLLAEGINVSKRRQKPRKSNEKGQTLEKAMPVDISNVLPWCSSCSKGVRVGSKIIKNDKVRICRSCEKEI